MKRIFTHAAPILVVLGLCSWQGGDPLEQWEKFSLSNKKMVLMNWLQQSAARICSGEKRITPPDVKLPDVYGRAGLFVTFIKNQKVRGCFGAFDHSSGDTAGLLIKYLKGALSYDPRYKPLELYELEDTDIVVTIASYPEQVENLNNVDISRFGVFIECEGSTGTVIVPAEYRTASSLNRNNSYSGCHVSRFRAVTIRGESR